MKDLKEMFVTLNEFRKEDPKEFYASIAFLIMLFGGFWAAMWLEAICSGRV